jgi:hypothetical protein
MPTADLTELAQLLRRTRVPAAVNLATICDQYHADNQALGAELHEEAVRYISRAHTNDNDNTAHTHTQMPMRQIPGPFGLDQLSDTVLFELNGSAHKIYATSPEQPPKTTEPIFTPEQRERSERNRRRALERKDKNKYEKQHEKYLALTGGRRLNATASIPAPTSPPVTATVPAKRHHALDEPKLPYHTLKTILPTLTKPALHMQGDYPYYIRLRLATNEAVHKQARLE